MTRRSSAAGWLLPAVLAGLLLGGCGGSPVSSVGPNTLVDDWAIGDAFPCNDDAAPLCTAFIEVATDSLNGRAPGHPDVIEAAVRNEGLYPNLDGDLGRIFRGGMGGFCCVVLIRLADSTYRAIGVGYVPSKGAGSSYALDHGPGVRQEHTENRPPAPTF